MPVVCKTEPYSQEVISPILRAGDVIGAVLLLNMDQKDLFEERKSALRNIQRRFWENRWNNRTIMDRTEA